MRKSDVLLVDYKVGNHLSIINALRFLGYNFVVSNKKEDIENARSYILPGVGAFAEAMKNLKELGIIDTLSDQVLLHKKPILGICLGMQVFAESSEEKGFHRGLGWFKARVMRISSKKDLRIPHVGWNNIQIKKKDPLFSRMNEDVSFYFDHSYHFVCDDEFVSATADYGQRLTAGIQKENIFGVQFHPERSQNNGLRLLRGFFHYVENLKE